MTNHALTLLQSWHTAMQQEGLGRELVTKGKPFQGKDGAYVVIPKELWDRVTNYLLAD